MFLILISVITQQLRHPPAIQAPHMHCTVSLTNITTYTHTYTHTRTHTHNTYALRCAAMQEANAMGTLLNM